MEKKYLVLVYCNHVTDDTFFEIKDNLERAKSLAKSLAQSITTSTKEFSDSPGITKVKLLDVSNNKEIEY